MCFWKNKYTQAYWWNNNQQNSTDTILLCQRVCRKHICLHSPILAAFGSISRCFFWTTKRNVQRFMMILHWKIYSQVFNCPKKFPSLKIILMFQHCFLVILLITAETFTVNRLFVNSSRVFVFKQFVLSTHFFSSHNYPVSHLMILKTVHYKIPGLSQEHACDSWLCSNSCLVTEK